MALPVNTASHDRFIGNLIYALESESIQGRIADAVCKPLLVAPFEEFVADIGSKVGDALAKFKDDSGTKFIILVGRYHGIQRKTLQSYRELLSRTAARSLRGFVCMRRHAPEAQEHNDVTGNGRQNIVPYPTSEKSCC